MKRILTIVLALIMLFSLAACTKDEAPKTDIQSNETALNFAIATDKGFSPFEFQDADGNIVGIDMDILKAVAQDQGFTYDLQYIGWDAAIAA